jgi:hypothetical protein
VGFNVVMFKDAQGERVVFQVGDGAISNANFTADGLGIDISYYRITNLDNFSGERTQLIVYRGGISNVISVTSTDQFSTNFIWRAPLDLSNVRLAAFQTYLAQVRQVVTCPGFMPSRLVTNAYGRVTPGKPNNMRNQANRLGAKVGEIPGDGLFYVLEGPVCDTEGRAWWRVDYNGLQGWTAEGEGTSYFTEPMP